MTIGKTRNYGPRRVQKRSDAAGTLSKKSIITVRNRIIGRREISRDRAVRCVYTFYTFARFVDGANSDDNCCTRTFETSRYVFDTGRLGACFSSSSGRHTTAVARSVFSLSENIRGNERSSSMYPVAANQHVRPFRIIYTKRKNRNYRGSTLGSPCKRRDNERDGTRRFSVCVIYTGMRLMNEIIIQYETAARAT